MSREAKCDHCGGFDLEPGQIQANGLLHFRPTNSKFMTFRTADVGVKANVCRDCGTVQLVADTRKLASLTERARPVVAATV